MKKDLLIIVCLLIPAISPLIQPGFFTIHDDLQAMRQLQMTKCFQDGQIPCRWSADMGYGYGFPIFNYYPPLPYLVGHIFTFMGWQHVDAVKAAGVFGFVITAYFMYLLGREFWGRKGGIIASVLYTYAPYHAVDYYVRGAVNEFYAMAFYPAIFYTSYKLISSKKPVYAFWLGVTFCGLMLSHNPMLFIFTPVFLMWLLYWLISRKAWKILPLLILSGVLALGLAAFFTIPVIFEAKYVHIETMVIGYFNYLAHFLSLKQMFLIPNWGFGASLYGPDDDMSFFVGYLHWIVPAIIVIFALLIKKFRRHLPLILFLGFISLGSLFVTHYKSDFVWKIIKPLEFMQFPWRFLTLSTFSLALLGGAVTIFVKNKIWLIVFIAAILTLNANYFKPDIVHLDATDATHFSGKSWQKLITSGIFDYLPKDAPLPPADPPSGDITFINGQGILGTVVKRSNYQQYQALIFDSPATVEIQTFYFPGWQVYLDSQQVTINPGDDALLGRMRLQVPPGRHTIEARLVSTPVRKTANLITLLTLMACPMIFVWLNRRSTALEGI